MSCRAARSAVADAVELPLCCQRIACFRWPHSRSNRHSWALSCRSLCNVLK
jgi:hypothetical protein